MYRLQSIEKQIRVIFSQNPLHILERTYYTNACICDAFVASMQAIVNAKFPRRKSPGLAIGGKLK